jgi:hypothetical protein
MAAVADKVVDTPGYNKIVSLRRKVVKLIARKISWFFWEIQVWDAGSGPEGRWFRIRSAHREHQFVSLVARLRIARRMSSSSSDEMVIC